MLFSNSACTCGRYEEERFRYDYVDRAKKLPGAGQYNTTGAVGVQPQSSKKTMPIYGFGSSTRDNRDKVRGLCCLLTSRESS